MKVGVMAFVVVAILAIASVAGFSSSANNAPAIGVAAPAFTLNSQEGKPVGLHDFKGKWVVLYFYPRTSRPGARSKRTISSATWRNTSRRMR